MERGERGVKALKIRGQGQHRRRPWDGSWS